MKTHTYKVVGHGAFPVDMLRYDHAWPATSDDGIKIADTFRGDTPYLKEVQVELTGVNKPTVGRWNSFGWHMLSVR